MLHALYETLIRSLVEANAGEEVIAAYRACWHDTLMGRSRVFSCPACFRGGVKHSPLAALPARGNIFRAKCQVCNQTYSCVEDEDL